MSLKMSHYISVHGNNDIKTPKILYRPCTRRCNDTSGVHHATLIIVLPILFHFVVNKIFICLPGEPLEFLETSLPSEEY